jgi:hypothetical protein
MGAIGRTFEVMPILQIPFENSSIKAQAVVEGARKKYAPGLHNCVFGAYFRGALAVVATMQLADWLLTLP